MIHGIAHLGVAVPDLEQAVRVYEQVLLARTVRRMESLRQGVRVAVMSVGGVEIELVEPLSADSGVGRFVAGRGGGLHHLGLEVDDVGLEIERLSAQGALLIDGRPQRPDVEDRVKAYAWVHPRTLGGVLLELVQFTPPRRG